MPAQTRDTQNSRRVPGTQRGKYLETTISSRRRGRYKSVASKTRKKVFALDKGVSVRSGGFGCHLGAFSTVFIHAAHPHPRGSAETGFWSKPEGTCVCSECSCNVWGNSELSTSSRESKVVGGFSNQGEISSTSFKPISADRGLWLTAKVPAVNLRDSSSL